MNKILTIIPTFNEAKNICPLIDQLFSLYPDLSVLVVDDNSPDKTSAIVLDLQRRYKKLYLITRLEKKGLGPAYQDGFKYAAEKDFDTIIQMDSDLSHQPQYISEMLRWMDEYDLVIGSRYVPGGGTSHWSFVRAMISRLANIFTKKSLGIPVHDSTSGFKCMRRRVLEAIDVGTITSKGYAFQIELVFRAYLKNIRIKEIPILFKGREKDRSKMSIAIVLEAVLRVINLSLRKRAVN